MKTNAGRCGFWRAVAVAAAFCFSGLGAFAETTTRQDGERWLVENAKLRLNLDPKEGTLSILDKGSAYEWRQVKIEKRSDEPFLQETCAWPKTALPLRAFSVGRRTSPTS